jgi:hypothetical protein
MPTRAQVHQSLTTQITHLVACYGITTSEAYDVLISTGYDLGRAGRICQDASANGTTINQLLAVYTPGPQEARE